MNEMNDDDEHYWGGDHVGQASRLQTAVRWLSSTAPPKVRFDRAITSLEGMLPHKSTMPPSQREKLDFIFERRAAVRRGSGEFYAFNDLSLKDRRAIIGAIIALHEACLIDLGRLNNDFTAIIYGSVGRNMVI